MLKAILAGVVLFLAMGSAIAQDGEEADHPLIPRYEESEIVKYETESFAAYPLLIAPLERSPAEAPDAFLDLEGRLTRITYRAPAQRSVLEVFRNYENALAEAGFTTVFTCAGEACGSSAFSDFAERERSMALWGDGRSHRFLSANRSGNTSEQDVYVALYVTKNISGGPSKDRAMVQLDVVELEPMEDRMVVVEADAMEQDLATDGHIALYGILFDTDKAKLRPDSKPQLDEIGKLLENEPTLEVLIVGHTDSQGALDYNLDLSRRRADSVVDTLVRDYGIDADRLTPMGVGMAAPVATNVTEEGRAQNRRVELVRR